MRLTDAAGQSVAESVVGRIEISGDNVMGGYYRNDAANRSALSADGWLDTGDLGFFHQGDLVITGRSKEIIFANGQNYYPHDIEDVALELDELELGKVVAVGLHRDETQSEELVVFLLYRGDLEAFLPLASRVARHINEQTGLEVTHVIPVKRIPKTTSGKLQRTALGREYLQGEFEPVLAELTALRAVAGTRAESAGANVQIGNALAQQIKSVFDDIAPEKQVGLDDDFFEIGISSLVLAQIHEKINESYPGKTDIVDLFEYTTINKLAGKIAGQQP